MNIILSIKVHMVVEHEWEVLQALREGTSVAWNTLVQQDSRLAPLRLTDCEAPGLPAAYRELTSASHISPDLTFRLYDTYGLHPDLIQELFEALGKHYQICELLFLSAKVKPRERYGQYKNICKCL